MAHSPRLEEIVALAGGPTRLALKLTALGKSITRQGVKYWRRVPPERVADVAEITGLPFSSIRPDLFYPDMSPRENAVTLRVIASLTEADAR